MVKGMVVVEIGRIIKEKRRAAGLTQEDLAKKIGCATITIRQYESGKREPGMDALIDISNALGIEIFDLVPEGQEQGNPFDELSEDQREFILNTSTGDDTLKKILTIFFRLPDDGKILVLKKLKQLEKEAKEESHAVDPQEN